MSKIIEADKDVTLALWTGKLRLRDLNNKVFLHKTSIEAFLETLLHGTKENQISVKSI